MRGCLNNAPRTSLQGEPWERIELARGIRLSLWTFAGKFWRLVAFPFRSYKVRILAKNVKLKRKMERTVDPCSLVLSRTFVSWSFSREKSKREGRKPEGSAGNMVCPFCSAMCTERVVFTNRRTCAFLAWMDFLGLVYGYLFKAFQVLTCRSTKWKLESSRFRTTHQRRSIIYENMNKIERKSYALRTKACYVGIKQRTNVPRHRIS